VRLQKVFTIKILASDLGMMWRIESLRVGNFFRFGLHFLTQLWDIVIDPHNGSQFLLGAKNSHEHECFENQ
jgi:hypothetical protein